MVFGSSMGQFMDPAASASHFHLRHGDTVADFGAGAGSYMKILSELVGPDGRVYAIEIQKNLVEKLGQIAREQHLMNVRPLWCDLEAAHGTKLDDGVLDAGMLINTLFQIENKPGTLNEIARVTRKGGKFFVIDWTSSFGGLGPQPQHVITETVARNTVEAAGFIFERTFPAGDHHYGLAFRRT